jgi:hypothetical protein
MKSCSGFRSYAAIYAKTILYGPKAVNATAASVTRKAGRSRSKKVVSGERRVFLLNFGAPPAVNWAPIPIISVRSKANERKNSHD